MKNYVIAKRLQKGKFHYCQDYSKVIKNEDSIIVLIADGHGGSPYCRSSLGARFAVYSASTLLSDSNVTLDGFPEAVKDKFDRLTSKHLAIHPLSDAERKLMNDKDPAEAYGTTLLGIRMSKDKLEGFQIGDGEIHVVNRKGDFITFLNPDEDCFANFTSSLCQTRDHVIRHFRKAIVNEQIAAVALYTDGYKADSPHPWEAVSLTVSGITDEKLDAVLDKHKSTDDRTFVLIYDSELSVNDDYVRALTNTTNNLSENERIQKTVLALREEYSRISTFLSLGIKKAANYKNRESDEYKRLAEMLAAQYSRYKEIKDYIKKVGSSEGGTV